MQHGGRQASSFARQIKSCACTRFSIACDARVPPRYHAPGTGTRTRTGTLQYSTGIIIIIIYTGVHRYGTLL